MERFTSRTHISWWEHSSHFRLIRRGVPSVSVVLQLVYNILCCKQRVSSAPPGKEDTSSPRFSSADYVF